MRKRLYKNCKLFKQWHYNYLNNRFINISQFLSNNDLIVLQTLGIQIENRLYTEREFEIYNMQILFYFCEEQNKQFLILRKLNIKKKDYDRILNIFNKISYIYNL